MNTFLLTVNGLFDFDFTFPLEALSFAILSTILTFFFLDPISKQLNKREIFLDYGSKKALVFFTLGYEEFLTSIDLVSEEIEELERQVTKFKELTSQSFEKELAKLQAQSLEIVAQAKGEVKIRSSFLFSTFLPEISKVTTHFFEQKIKLN